ncbi:MAG: hypothetical protein ACTSRA_00170 [Promethearchaeota archaeon]|nr:MAG: hypothetical protein [Helarchaeota virus Nidhogg Meg22_1012]URC17371.1 MAG: hypothetical protein [Helarchaeota virus Nidhogg Meg22_1214]
MKAKIGTESGHVVSKCFENVSLKIFSAAEIDDAVLATCTEQLEELDERLSAFKKGIMELGYFPEFTYIKIPDDASWNAKTYWTNGVRFHCTFGQMHHGYLDLNANGVRDYVDYYVGSLSYKLDVDGYVLFHDNYECTVFISGAAESCC